MLSKDEIQKQQYEDMFIHDIKEGKNGLHQSILGIMSRNPQGRLNNKLIQLKLYRGSKSNKNKYEMWE